jgi:multiple sugar transport system substrate-binding protein
LTRKQLSRRDFLKAAAAASGAAALGIAPILSRRVALAQDPVTLKFAVHWDLSFQPVQEEFDAKFTEAHPNITIEKIYNTWADHNTAVVTWAAAGELPDFVYVHGSRAVPWSKGGILLPLDSYIAADEEFNVDGVFQEALRLYNVDGKQWAIPYDHGPIILGYNKDAFDAAGLDYPAEDWTLDDLATAAKALTIPGQQWGFGPRIGLGNETAPAFIGTFGGATFNEAEDGLLLDTDESRAGLNFWVDLIFKDHAMSDEAEAASFQNNDVARFSGQFAMFPIATWDTPGFVDLATFKWDVAPWPSGPAGRRTGSFGSGFGGTATTTHPDEVWQYLSEYLSQEGMEFMWAASGRGSPAREAAYPAYLASPLVPEHAQYFLEAMENYAITGRPYASVTGPEVATVITNNLTLLSTGEITVDQFIAQVLEESAPIFAREA